MLDTCRNKREEGDYQRGKNYVFIHKNHFKKHGFCEKYLTPAKDK